MKLCHKKFCDAYVCLQGDCAAGGYTSALCVST